MYDPKEAMKTYRTLLIEKGAASSVKSALLIMFWFLGNQCILQQEVSLPLMIGVYFYFCVYFTWKPKFISFIKGRLRGKE